MATSKVAIIQAGGFPACSRWLREVRATPPDHSPHDERIPEGCQKHHASGMTNTESPCWRFMDVTAYHRRVAEHSRGYSECPNVRIVPFCDLYPEQLATRNPETAPHAPQL